jgi:hypothetical protein
MADMRDWYYRQKVLEDELDGAFGALETADWRVIADLGLCRHNSEPGVYGGIAWGFNAMHLSGLDIFINPGAAYREDGKRTGTSTNYTVNTAYTGSCPIGQGGHGDGTTVLGAPGDVGKECIVSIFLAFDRLLSDERYDGYNQKVYFKRNESFHFYLTMGAHKLIVDPGDPTPPARETDGFLVADVRLQNPSGTVTYHSISQTRREWMLNLSAINAPHKTITTGRIREAIYQLLEYYNEHINGNADRHPANDIDFAPTQVWADGTGGTYGTATVVGNAINDIVIDLSQITEVAGAKRVGAKAQAGSLSAPGAAHPLSLVAGTLESQLTDIMRAVNGRVFRGGDDGIGLLAPAIDGTTLGSALKSWDAFLRDVTVKGAVKSNLIPGINNAYDLGSTGSYWRNLFVAAAEVSGTLEANYLRALTDLTCEDTLNVDGVALFNGYLHATFQARFDREVAVIPNPGSGGLMLSCTDGSSGGLLGLLASKTASTQPWANLDRCGAVMYGPLFTDNFQYVAQSPSQNIADHLPPHKWKANNAFTSFGYELGNASEKRFIGLWGGSGDGSARSNEIVAGGWWDVGRFRGLMCKFSMGINPYAAPPAGTYMRGGFRGRWYGFEATIRLDADGCWAFFNNGSQVAWGAVNLIGGPAALGAIYTFRIVIVNSNYVWVVGPGGYEQLIPSSGAIDSGETCEWFFSVDSYAVPTIGVAGQLLDIWINEQNPRILE